MHDFASSKFCKISSTHKANLNLASHTHMYRDPVWLAYPPKRAAGILPGRPHLDRRTIRVLNQSLWLKSLTARQRCLAGNANALLFLRNNSPHVPTPNLEDQETVFVRPLAIDQPGMRDSVSVAGTLPSIAQWIAEVRKPPHHGKVLSLREGTLGLLETKHRKFNNHEGLWQSLLEPDQLPTFCQVLAVYSYLFTEFPENGRFFESLTKQIPSFSPHIRHSR
ncbi:hypothetical protein CSKR_109938 [Clonorchis sinensis]|uniref:Uncharacterized protein n=1 Tax=Clonorchis sinensis TaxID=79923 RepID=A0A419PK58_CLOSI|nr:hypothetical protein CSKR_109938 [Clonorchis sinensis]